MPRPLFLLPACALFALSAQPPADHTAPSSIPADAAQRVNPVKATPESLGRARKMYGYDCAMCHGPDGKGKGDLVADMKLSLMDYSDPAALKSLSDGEIFYIIKNGKGQMSGEGDRAKPDDIWNLVILLRSFSRK